MSEGEEKRIAREIREEKSKERMMEGPMEMRGSAMTSTRSSRGTSQRGNTVDDVSHGARATEMRVREKEGRDGGGGEKVVEWSGGIGARPFIPKD